MVAVVERLLMITVIRSGSTIIRKSGALLGPA